MMPGNREWGALMDIVVWLRSLGLEEYEAAFRDSLRIYHYSEGLGRRRFRRIEGAGRVHCSPVHERIERVIVEPRRCDQLPTSLSAYQWRPNIQLKKASIFSGRDRTYIPPTTMARITTASRT
jgi:hypothetical protein